MGVGIGFIFFPLYAVLCFLVTLVGSFEPYFVGKKNQTKKAKVGKERLFLKKDSCRQKKNRPRKQKKKYTEKKRSIEWMDLFRFSFCVFFLSSFSIMMCGLDFCI